MNQEEKDCIEQIKKFAQTWNELYASEKFDAMKELATEDVGIANVQLSTDETGLIYGREAYKQGIVEAYRGKDEKQQNLLIMQYESWEYIPLAQNLFYTIGRYTLEPDYSGVNCWLLRRDDPNSPWRIFRVINN